MLREALSYPRRADDWLRTALIGAVLIVLSPFVLPVLAVQGYLVRVLRAVVDGSEEPPVFDEWGELLVDGLKSLVVQFAYGLIPAGLAFVGSIALGLGMFVVTEGGGTSAGFGAGVGLVVALIFLLVFLFSLLATYLTPVAIANFAREDDLAAAFDFGTVREVATSRAYLVAVLYALVVGLVVAVVSVLLSITIVGIVLVFFVAFYAQVAVYYVLGRGFAEALDIDSGGVGAVGADGDDPTG